MALQQTSSGAFLVRRGVSASRRFARPALRAQPESTRNRQARRPATPVFKIHTIPEPIPKPLSAACRVPLALTREALTDRQVPMRVSAGRASTLPTQDRVHRQSPVSTVLAGPYALALTSVRSSRRGKTAPSTAYPSQAPGYGRRWGNMQASTSS
jgi:hypothetical protein